MSIIDCNLCKKYDYYESKCKEGFNCNIQNECSKFEGKTLTNLCSDCGHIGKISCRLPRFDLPGTPACKFFKSNHDYLKQMNGPVLEEPNPEAYGMNCCAQDCVKYNSASCTPVITKVGERPKCFVSKDDVAKIRASAEVLCQYVDMEAEWSYDSIKEIVRDLIDRGFSVVTKTTGKSTKIKAHK
jgi:hypothetical protein